MGVYVDVLRPAIKNSHWRHNESCHLIADTNKELLLCARKIGLKDHWIQKRDTPAEHYDLTPYMRHRALMAGARSIDTREFFEVINNKRQSDGRAKGE